MNKWRAVTFLAIPACTGFAVYSLANAEHHHEQERPAYSYLRRRLKIFPWGGDCGLFEYGKCQEE
jgi:cytochrome c oxidase subunit 6a